MSQPSLPTLTRRQRGLIAFCAALSACALAAIVFSLRSISLFEPEPDWHLRAALTIAGAVAAAWLGRLLIGRAIDRGMSASLIPGILMAAVPLALVGWLLSDSVLSAVGNYIGSLILGFALGMIWRRWTAPAPVWVVWSSLAGPTALFLALRGNLPGLFNAGYGLNKLLSALSAGLVWSVLCAPVLYLMAGRLGGQALRDLREDAEYARQTGPKLPRWITPVALTTLIALTGAAVWQQGIQSCHWIDRLAGRSGCYRTIAIDSKWPEDIDISADGAIAAVLGLHSLEIVNVAAGESSRTIALPSDVYAEQVTLAPDNRLAAITTSKMAASDMSIIVYRLGDGGLERSIAVDAVFVNAPAFSQDGATIVLADHVWRVADGADLGQLAPADRARYRLNEPSFGDKIRSADGALVAEITGRNVGIRPVTAEGDLDGVTRTLTLSDTPDYHLEGAFSADKGLLGIGYQAAQDTTTLQVWELSDGRQILNLTRHDPLKPAMLGFTPDNQFLIAFNDRRMDFYRLK